MRIIILFKDLPKHAKATIPGRWLQVRALTYKYRHFLTNISILVPTAQQQISSSPESNSSDEIDLTAHPLHMAYLQQDNSIPRDKSKSQSWETKIYSAWISPAELDVLFGS